MLTAIHRRSDAEATMREGASAALHRDSSPQFRAAYRAKVGV